MMPLASAGLFAATLMTSQPAAAEMVDSSAPRSIGVLGGATGGSAIGSPLGKPAGLAGLRLSGPIAFGSGGDNDTFLARLGWNVAGIFTGGGVSHIRSDRSFATRFCGGLTGSLGYFGDTSFGVQAEFDLCGGFGYLERSLDRFKEEGGFGAIVGALWRGGLFITIDRGNMNDTIKNWKIIPGVLGFLNFWGVTPESSRLNPFKFEKSGLSNVPGPKLFPFLELGFGF